MAWEKRNNRLNFLKLAIQFGLLKKIVVKSNFKEQCQKSEQCITIDYLKCLNDQCLCEEGFKWDLDKCSMYNAFILNFVIKKKSF